MDHEIMMYYITVFFFKLSLIQWSLQILFLKVYIYLWTILSGRVSARKISKVAHKLSKLHQGPSMYGSVLRVKAG